MKTFAAPSLLLLLAACSSAESTSEVDDSNLKGISVAARKAAVLRGEVFTNAPLSLSAAEVKAGPKLKETYAFNQEIACDFVEPDMNDKLGGLSPKFNCKLPDGKIVKVKYSRKDRNDEVYGEIVSSRIQWLMGMPADAIYPVRVTCRNCPEEPWSAYVDAYVESKAVRLIYPSPGPRATRSFPAAAIEVKYDAKKMEDTENVDGWAFDELASRSSDYWSKGRAERSVVDKAHPEQVAADAIRMYAAFVKHLDSKADNQRLVCAKKDLSEEGVCAHPLLMIHDGGISYGSGGRFFGSLFPKDMLSKWTNQFENPMWKDFSKCEAGIRSLRSGSITNPRVSNAGRAALVERLNSITDEELRAVFEAARIEEKGEYMKDPLTGIDRPVTIQDWVKGFNYVRSIAAKACPEKP